MARSQPISSAREPQASSVAPSFTADDFVSVFACGECGNEAHRLDAVLSPVCCGLPMLWVFDVRGDLLR